MTTRKIAAGRSASAGERTVKALAFATLIILAALMILPLYIMVSTALKTQQDVFLFPPEWVPSPAVWHNFIDAMKARSFGRYFYNTSMYAVVGTFGEVFSSAFVAYGFSRYRGYGRGAMFLILLATMMIPYPVTMIPQFVLFKNLGWIDSYLPLNVPSFLGSAYIIFLLRQFFSSVPVDLFEAARLDGCSELRTFWNIALPLCSPALASAAIFGFMYRWNDYLGPLIYLNTDSKFTVSIALSSFTSMFNIVPWHLLMAAGIVAILPPTIIFFLAQKYFVQGIVVSGLK
ncbi:multiple sugar transport system permease protein [Paenibacillus sp. UNC496MF]|uniref:carbohydrate ABC transporter permease n=1 Tax=Paenibacillus sp. UNC496MF TaxID=1502753 RepID=UPI0008F39627|nr:carbohydrate ABC transporter permease [Paenibacillus sp. UNC496MF]SFI39884.1 multiple sugar transport system permease protein [Paenibacillus sp. UNC496MF]